MPPKPRRPTEPTVTFHGAARSVTGSMHRLDACGRTLLLDCGLFQGHRADSLRRNRDFPFRPRSVSLREDSPPCARGVA